MQKNNCNASETACQSPISRNLDYLCKCVLAGAVVSYASFGTTPLAMQQAIRLMDRGLVNPEAVITHRFQLSEIHKAVEVMARRDRNKVIVNP